MNNDLKAMHNAVSEYIKANWKKSMNEPTGILKHKFLDPAANYRGQLWDWDSYFCGLALADVYERSTDYIKGCVRNFVDNQASDGSIPYMINTHPADSAVFSLPEADKSVRTADSEFNSAKPLLAQMAMLAYGKDNDLQFVSDVYAPLEKHIEHWENTQWTESGLFVWRSQRGSGTDNHPAVYGRPLNSSAAVDLNCFMYSEYLAIAQAAKLLGKTVRADFYEKRAKKLAENINLHMWDGIDEIYYHLDMLSKNPAKHNQIITWDVPLKFKAWTCFMPMYAKIAPREYADLMVKRHICNRDEFWSDFGIRTLARNEPAYNTAETSNPSNWQGPVWIVSSYLVFMGLVNYGYFGEAESLCRNLLGNLLADIAENGAMHEYYNPETGKSTVNLGFMNWNALAGLMIPELERAKKLCR